MKAGEKGEDKDQIRILGLSRNQKDICLTLWKWIPVEINGESLCWQVIHDLIQDCKFNQKSVLYGYSHIFKNIVQIASNYHR